MAAMANRTSGDGDIGHVQPQAGVRIPFRIDDTPNAHGDVCIRAREQRTMSVDEQGMEMIWVG